MFKVYSKPHCPFCVKAEQLLISRGILYKKIDVTQDQEALNMLKSQGFRSVPQIYAPNEDHVGGFEDLVKYLSK